MYINIVNEFLNSDGKAQYSIEKHNAYSQLCSTCLRQYADDAATVMMESHKFDPDISCLILNNIDTISNQIEYDNLVFRLQNKKKHLLVLKNPQPLSPEELYMVEVFNQINCDYKEQGGVYTAEFHPELPVLNNQDHSVSDHTNICNCKEQADLYRVEFHPTLDNHHAQDYTSNYHRMNTIKDFRYCPVAFLNHAKHTPGHIEMKLGNKTTLCVKLQEHKRQE